MGVATGNEGLLCALRRGVEWLYSGLFVTMACVTA